MKKDSLYNVAKRYVEIIEALEKTDDEDRLLNLEEQRAIWHNRLMDKLKEEGLPFKDRDHVTRIAYRIVEREL